MNFLPVHRWRQWLACTALAMALLSLFTTTRAFADDAPAASAAAPASDPVPDKTGAFQSTPTAYSVPGYTKTDPEKATTKELATAVVAFARSASHGVYAGNFVRTLVAGFRVMFMHAGFALFETGLIRAKNEAATRSTK